jgi:hypothetical protein
LRNISKIKKIEYTVHGHKQVEKYICFERVHTIDSPLKASYFSLPRNLVPEVVMPAFGQGKFVRAYGRQTVHMATSMVLVNKRRS